LTDQQAEKVAKSLGFVGSSVAKVQKQLERLYKFFCEKDVIQLEVNPFVETSTGEGNSLYYGDIITLINIFTVLCMDAKLNIDDNADFRQKEIFAMEDLSQKDPRQSFSPSHNK
jgi:succinyl-CoA synthetase beta subunit